MPQFAVHKGLLLLLSHFCSDSSPLASGNGELAPGLTTPDTLNPGTNAGIRRCISVLQNNACTSQVLKQVDGATLPMPDFRGLVPMTRFGMLLLEAVFSVSDERRRRLAGNVRNAETGVHHPDPSCGIRG